MTTGRSQRLSPPTNLPKPTRQQFIKLFAPGEPFTGNATDGPEDGYTGDIACHIVGKCWTDFSLDHLLMMQLSLPWLSNEALAYFLPVFVLEAMDDLDKGDLDHSVLQFVTNQTQTILSLGYTTAQLTLLVQAVDFIHANSHEQFDGLDAAIRTLKAGTPIEERVEHVCISGPKGHVSLYLKPGEVISESTRQMVIGITGLSPRKVHPQPESKGVQ